MSVYRIAMTGSVDGTYRTERTLVESVLGQIKIRAIQEGWHGQQIHDADWIKSKTDPDMVLIVLEPGLGDVNVDQLRAFIKDRKARERREANVA